MRKLRSLLLFTVLSFFTTVAFSQEIKEKAKAVKVVTKWSELPDAVIKKLGKEFENNTTKRVYKAKKNGEWIFYLKLAEKSEEILIVIDAKGNIIKQKD